MIVAVAFALLAAFCNTLIVVSQRLANTRASSELKGRNLVLHLVKSPLWLLGMAALLGSFVCQAVALHAGQLSLVQPLLVSELIFALMLRRAWLRQSISTVAWGSAVVTCLSLSLFIVVASPSGGVGQPSAAAWFWSIGGFGGAAALLFLLGSEGSPVRRAAFLGAATALMWALVAAFIKATTNDLTSSGFPGVFAHWPVYALAVSGALGFFMEQYTLHAGPLSVSQPLLVIVDPIVSVGLGITLFDERLPHHPAKLAVVALSLAMLSAGGLVLARATPDSMEPVAQSPT